MTTTSASCTWGKTFQHSRKNCSCSKGGKSGIPAQQGSIRTSSHSRMAACCSSTNFIDSPLSRSASSIHNKSSSTSLFLSKKTPCSRIGVRAMAGYSFSEISSRDSWTRHAQWQSQCAIISSQTISVSDTPGSNNGQSEVKLNGTTDSSHQLLLTAAATSAVALRSLPKPLSIADLATPPTHGSQLRVAYQGVPGAYSEAAAAKAYPDCDAVPCDQFEAVFQSVELWIADRAVLPIENSLGGSIHRNYDLLLRHRLHIVGEVQLPVHHCLLGLPGATIESLRRVISHPQALSQVEHTLTKIGVHAAREAVDDTAGAAQYIAENNLRDTAAVASARAAEIYGMEILASGIQDDPGNVTRFLMLAREPIIPRTDRKFKTSIVFALAEEPGALFKALSAFSLRGINLTKIESRPQRNRPLRVVDDNNHGTAKYFEYLFYIDFEASMADPRAQNALGQLQEFASFIRVLGSYAMDMTPVVPPGNLPKVISS